MAESKNVLGEKLEIAAPTHDRFLSTGTCETGPQDVGTHVICAQVTKEFLTYTKSRGNEATPGSAQGFLGLKPGDAGAYAQNAGERPCRPEWPHQ